MKNRYIFICFLFICNIVYASQISLDISSNNLNVKEYLYCIEDKDETFDFKEILKSNNLQKMQKTNFGYSFSTYWCKVSLNNSSQQKRTFIFYNPRPSVDFIDVNIYTNNGIKSVNLGDRRALENRDLNSIYSNFSLSLKSEEKAIIIAKYKSNTVTEVNWKIAHIKEFISKQNIDFVLICLYIGFMVAIMFQKLFSYYYIKDKIYIVYAVFVFSAIVSHLSNVGILHYFFFDYLHNYTIGVASAIFSHLFLTFLWIFTYMFFNINKKSIYFYPLVFIILYNVCVTLVYIYSYIDVKVFAFTPLILLAAIIESLLLLIFSFIMYIQKRPGSRLFLLGHISYIASILYYIVSLVSGKQIDPINAMHVAALGIFFATYFMSLSLSSKFKTLKDEHDKIKLEIEKNKQFTIVGATISYVTHQWREPLSKLASKVMYLQALMDNKPNTQVVDVKDEIIKIQGDVKFINNTLSDIKALFKIEKSKKATFTIKDTLNKIMNEYDEIIHADNIKIKIDINKNMELYGVQNLFIHALSNILNNSIDAINKNNISSGKIKIYNNDENTFLIIEDNAMGINEKSLDTLFDVKSSSKSEGMGIGLNITNEILNKEFDIKVSVENIKNGVRFILKSDS